MEESEKRIMERQELDRRIEVGDIEFINRFFSTDLSVAELVGSYNAGRRDFADIGLCNLDLSGINLAGANLTGAKLVSTNLSSANLAGANLSYTYLAGANLNGANLTNANLTRAIMAGVNLENANLRGAISKGIEDHQAFYCNTVMPDGSVEIGPYWAEG
ncbi:pentapeptide repeat-containing protein [Chlorogloeopsis fritschii]|uniref:pentapeptide repeat-containing protein n=1 Tax=Chlorogloeopsis fritschii TaxID=1124 RepID=UPI0023F87278|nr:pentapeptide repeat-containing protein [Chlorogloeopsis fritschii]